MAVFDEEGSQGSRYATRLYCHWHGTNWYGHGNLTRLVFRWFGICVRFVVVGTADPQAAPINQIIRVLSYIAAGETWDDMNTNYRKKYIPSKFS